MKNPFLSAESIYLRRIEHGDLESNYFQWLNDQEVTLWTQHGIFPNSRESMEEYFSTMSGSSADIVLAIILKKGDRHVGNIGIHRIHPVFRCAEIGILIGEKDIWGQGVGSGAIRLVVSHAFSRLNLNRLYAGVVEKNTGCIRAFENAGFVREGVAREAYYCEGGYVNCINLGLLRSDWLKHEMPGRDTD
jgi:[ribosomal protein S5]-alanine N-acetyltransferase